MFNITATKCIVITLLSVPIFALKANAAEQLAEKVTTEESTDKSIAQEASINKPIVDELITNEQATDESVAEEIIAETSINSELIADEQVTDESIAEEIIAETSIESEPIVDEQVADESVTEDSIAETSIESEPIVDEQVADELNTNEQAIDESVPEDKITKATIESQLIPIEVLNDANVFAQYDDKKPMVANYFTAHNEQEIIDFYQEKYGEINSQTRIKESLMLKFTVADNNIRIIISAQGKNQQVDILIN